MAGLFRLDFKLKAFLLLFSCVLLSVSGCGKRHRLDPRIGLIGVEDPVQRVDEALSRMGERFEVLKALEPSKLAGFDLVILGREAFSRNDASLADNYQALLEYVRNGGCLLVFGLEDNSFRKEFLPYEIRFAAEDPSGWGNVDFTEEIADPQHPVFNSPHRLTYLAGLEEPSRIVYTAPEWRILLSKDPGHPAFDYKLEKRENNVGSILEAGYGKGHILVCQPIIERYYAEHAAIVPHPLEAGVLLFENLIEYMKRRSIDKNLPLVTAGAYPERGAAGETVRFSAVISGGAGAPFTFNWEFGDCAGSIEPAPEHKYKQDGVYRATVTVTDASGAVDRHACRIEAGPGKTMRWADYLIEALMNRYYPDPGQVGINYRTALLLDGMLDVYERTKDPQILEYISTFFRRRLLEKWDNRPYKQNMQPGLDFVDIYSLMSPAYRIFRISGDSLYLKMALEVWEQSLAVDSELPPDGLWSPWSWHGRRAIVDFTYFKAQLRGYYWEETGDMRVMDDAALQMIRFSEVFMDPADSLFFMAVDLDRQAFFCSPDRPSGLNDSKWGRANGWVAMAFTELMTRLPENHPRRDRLLMIVRAFFTGLTHAQDPETGLWALVTDKRDYPGMWLETTSSSMFVYSMARLVEAGILPEDPFLGCARRGYNGLQQRIKLGAFSYPYLSDACEGTMVRISLARWLEAHRQDNNFHALGPFLRAEEAVWRLAPPEFAVIGSLRPAESTLGQALNRAGLYFHQIPDLYTAGNLGAYQAMFVDKGAFDRNDADIRAYHEYLLDYVGNGGTVVYFPQEDENLLQQALPPGITFTREEGRELLVQADSSWNVVQYGSGEKERIFKKNYGKGKVVYWEHLFPDAILSGFGKQ
ncbi:MAG TPA: glycoside hydrolase family 88 protein [archaeon]|nr:glycoside hydrolase family 88 protein [archaeon]